MMILLLLGAYLLLLVAIVSFEFKTWKDPRILGVLIMALLGVLLVIAPIVRIINS